MISKKIVLVYFIMLTACTRAGMPPVSLTIPVSNNTSTTQAAPSTAPEPVTDPEREVTEIKKLPDYPARPILKGTTSPEDGLLISPRNAAEAALNAAKAERLAIENKVMTNTHNTELSLRDTYQKILEEENKELKKKSWWDKHGSSTMFGIGLAAGIAMSLAVFKTAVKISE